MEDGCEVLSQAITVLAELTKAERGKKLNLHPLDKFHHPINSTLFLVKLLTVRRIRG